MDQDTWYNDYKSIGEAGYRLADDILFFYFLFLRWRNFKTFVEENAVDETDDIVFFIQGLLNSYFFPRVKAFISGASIGDNLSQIEIYENGLKKAENFEVALISLDLNKESFRCLSHLQNQLWLTVALIISSWTLVLGINLS